MSGVALPSPGAPRIEREHKFHDAVVALQQAILRTYAGSIRHGARPVPGLEHAYSSASVSSLVKHLSVGAGSID